MLQVPGVSVDEDLLDVPTVARVMALSEDAVQKLVDCGYIRSVQVDGRGVVPASEIDWLIKRWDE